MIHGYEKEGCLVVLVHSNDNKQNLGHVGKDGLIFNVTYQLQIFPLDHFFFILSKLQMIQSVIGVPPEFLQIILEL